MPVIHISASTTIRAPGSLVYGIIADYRDGHPRILPPEYFGRLEVLAGGRGAGTRIRFEMKAFGKTNVSVAEVSEPVPGRELRETLSDGIVTTFLVEPLGAAEARVTISTTYHKPGLRGWLERLIAPGYLRRVYTAELAQLGRVAADRQHAA
ncbi:MAG: SRPBCC family protein [Gemmatimonadaceae bacterium]